MSSIWSVLLVAMNRSIPIHRPAFPATVPKQNHPPTSRRGMYPQLQGGDLRLCSGLNHTIRCQNFKVAVNSDHVQRSTTTDNVQSYQLTS